MATASKGKAWLVRALAAWGTFTFVIITAWLFGQLDQKYQLQLELQSRQLEWLYSGLGLSFAGLQLLSLVAATLCLLGALIRGTIVTRLISVAMLAPTLWIIAFLVKFWL